MRNDRNTSGGRRQGRQRKPQQGQEQQQAQQRGQDMRESGLPGGGAGRRDEVGPTGVHPASAGIDPQRNAEIRTPASWGQGERGAEGYNDAGGSELVMREGQLLGGLTAGPGGEPTIDIHGGDQTATPEHRPEDTTPKADKEQRPGNR